MTWSARQYLEFEDERTRPVRDLVLAIPDISARRAIDIGCGPGTSTEVLAARFPQAAVSGIDSSEDMVAAARRRLPHLRFDVADVASWRDTGSYDVILANAVLQWLPHHEKLLPALLDRVAAGGALAVQMPDNLDEPSHVLMREIALSGPWSAKLKDAAATRTTLPGPRGYFTLLADHASQVDVWRTTYYHRLKGGVPAIVEWFKGSGLRPFLAPLSEEERQDYLRRYSAAIAGAYPVLHDGSVLLPFPRLFMLALRQRAHVQES